MADRREGGGALIVTTNGRRAGGGGGLETGRRGWFRGRSKVRLIPTLKVERGRAGFIARALVLLFAQPGVDL